MLREAVSKIKVLTLDEAQHKPKKILCRFEIFASSKKMVLGYRGFEEVGLLLAPLGADLHQGPFLFFLRPCFGDFSGLTKSHYLSSK